MHKFIKKIQSSDLGKIEEFLCENEMVNWMIDHDADTHEDTLCGYFDDKICGNDSSAIITENFPELVGFDICEVKNEDWENEYKKYLKPWSYMGLHWVPVWFKDSYTAMTKDSEIVYIDSGMAFGTGSHETTRLCAQAIVNFKRLYSSNNDFILKSFIDAGCGSGILAISAQKLGYTDIYGFDIDPKAVQISKENAKLNGISEGEITFEVCDLSRGLLGRQVDFLAANILSNVLTENIEILINSINVGGMLCLSGILESESNDVYRKFTERIEKVWKSNMIQMLRDGEWSAITFFRG